MTGTNRASRSRAKTAFLALTTVLSTGCFDLGLDGCSPGLGLDVPSGPPPKTRFHGGYTGSCDFEDGTEIEFDFNIAKRTDTGGTATLQELAIARDGEEFDDPDGYMSTTEHDDAEIWLKVGNYEGVMFVLSAAPDDGDEVFHCVLNREIEGEGEVEYSR